jgi:hypothetical protein
MFLGQPLRQDCGYAGCDDRRQLPRQPSFPFDNAQTGVSLDPYMPFIVNDTTFTITSSNYTQRWSSTGSPERHLA